MTATGRKLQLIASMIEARTQPLVVAPVTTTVSTPRWRRIDARPVSKNADGWVLRMTTSPRRGARKSTTWLAGALSVSWRRPGTFSHHTPAFEPSSS